jgi:hypothetical protein
MYRIVVRDSSSRLAVLNAPGLPSQPHAFAPDFELTGGHQIRRTWLLAATLGYVHRDHLDPGTELTLAEVPTVKVAPLSFA